VGRSLRPSDHVLVASGPKNIFKRYVGLANSIRLVTTLVSLGESLCSPSASDLIDI